MADLNDIQLRIIVQGTGLDNLQRTNDHLARMMSNLNNTVAPAQAATSAWTKFRDALSELERKFDAVFRAASHLQALGSDLTGMGEAGLGALKGAVDQWGEYEFAIHRAAGALSVFDTQSPMFHALTKAVDEAAQEVRLFPAEEIARAVYYWGSATGQTVENQQDLTNVMNGLIPILKTAAITEADYESAIKGTYQIVQQYGLGLTRMATEQDVASGKAKRVGEELSNVGDITEKLMMITQNTSLEYQDLIESFRYTGSIAPALGVTWEELAVVLGRLGDLGIRGSGAGRALQQTFSKLVDPTVRASKALDTAWQKAYGLDKTFNDMVFPEGKFIGLTEYIDMLADVTEDMTQKERNNLIAIMTTQNELRTMVPLIEDQIKARKSGISVYDSEKFALENASEQFERTMHLLEISWKGTMGYLAATIGPVVRLIGAQVASIAAPFIEQFGQILKSVKAWLDTHPEVVEWGVKIAAVVSVILLLAGALFTAVGVLLAFGAGFVFVIKTAGIFFGTFTKFLPIVGAVVTAIGAFVTIWTNNMSGIQEAVGRVVEAFGRLAEKLNFGDAAGVGVLDKLGTVIMPALEAIAWVLVKALDALAWTLDRIADSPEAVAVVQALLTAMSALIAISFAAKIGNMALSIVTLGGSAKGTFLPLKLLLDSMSRIASFSTLRHPIRAFKDLRDAIHIAAESAANKGKSIKDAIMGIGPKATAAAGTVRGAMAGMAASVKGAATGISLSIKSVLIATGIGALIVAIGLLVEAWINNWGDIQGKFAAVVSWIGDRINDIISFFSNLPANVGRIMSNIWTTVSTWVGTIIAAIVAFPGTIWQAIVDGFNNIMTFLGEWWTSLGESTSERIGFIIGFIIAFPIRILIELVKGFAGIWMWFVEWWENLMAAIGNWVTGIVTVVLDWFGKLPGALAGFFGTIWNNFVAWWEGLMAAIGRWVQGVVTTILDWIGKLPGRIAGFFSQLWTNISTWWTDFIPAAGQWASQAVANIITFIQQLPGKVMKFFGDLFRNVSTWFTVEFVPNVGTWTMDAVKRIVKFFLELPGKAIDAIQDLVPKMIGFMRTLPGKILDAVVNVGKRIVEGVWKGISDAWKWFTDQVTGFFRGIINGVKNALGIASPSKVFADIGTQMMAGLAVGVNKNRDAVDAVKDQVQTLVDTARALKAEESSLTSDFAFTSDGERRLIVEHQVSSPDGTVNAASRDTLRQIFTAEEFVSALEHMATVG